MNLRDLRYLIAVADHRHFRRAAEAEHVSQPTLSAQIRKLEDELGIQLFERDSRNVALTTAGCAVLEEARAVIAHAGAIRDLAAAHRDPLAGEFSLGVIASLGPFLAPDLLGRVQAAAPGLSLRIYEALTEQVLSAVRTRELDAALIATVPDGDDLIDRPLFDEPFLAALPPGHRLTAVESFAMSDIGDSTLLLLTEGHCLRDQALSLCSAKSVDTRVRATSLFTLFRLAAQGAGMTLVPRLAAPYAQGVTLRPLTDAGAKRQVRIVVRRHFPRIRAVDVIAGAARSVASAQQLRLIGEDRRDGDDGQG